jgi:hypothetical protein
MYKQKPYLTDKEYTTWIDEVVDDLVFLIDERFLERRDFRDYRLTKPFLIEKLGKLSRDLQSKEDLGKTHGKNPDEVLTPSEFRAGKALENIFALDDRIGIREAFDRVQARRWEQPPIQEWDLARKLCDRVLRTISDRVLESAHRSLSRAQRKCNRLRYDL